MAWRKSPPALIARFDEMVPRDERIERRQMFGYPAAFVNGNLFASLFQESFILRLDAADRATLEHDLGGAPFEPMPGRAMREYVALPDAVMRDDKALQRWLDRSLAYAVTIPAKQRKTKTPRRTAARKSPA